MCFHTVNMYIYIVHLFTPQAVLTASTRLYIYNIYITYIYLLKSNVLWVPKTYWPRDTFKLLSNYQEALASPFLDMPMPYAKSHAN